MAGYEVRYGGKTGPSQRLLLSSDLLVVRTWENLRWDRVARGRASQVVAEAFRTEWNLPQHGVTVLRTKRTSGARAQVAAAKAALSAEPGILFAGRVLRDTHSRRPVLYTENLFVQFLEETGEARRRGILDAMGLTIKRPIEYIPHAYFVAAPPGTGRGTFAIAKKLLAAPEIVLCHPELIRIAPRKRAFAQQWHLWTTTIEGTEINAHAHVTEAWELSTGKGTTIALIDDGVDIDHEEFAAPGKIVHPRDVSLRMDDASPVWGGIDGDNHGTACAGVACALGQDGASGVAPDAHLMPIRNASGLGSQNEADAIAWATDHGADVISCSWGPVDGDPNDASDPTHEQMALLPDSTRLAMEYAVREGRQGLGCVITWAAGNGNESIATDGYASRDEVIAVAACNDRGTRSYYSDFGEAVWCCFPSNDFGPPRPRTPGIWTTDRRGNDGYAALGRGGDPAGNYTDSFGGTSSAAPGVAGVVALMLSTNPRLTWKEVKRRLADSCEQIDVRRGRYDARGHSTLYGYGRVNARRAVELAAT